MINAVGRDIPQEVIDATGKKVFEGVYAYDNYEYKKAAPTVHTVCDPKRSKMVENIHDALVKCGIQRRYDHFLPSSFPRGRLHRKHGNGRDPQHGYQGYYHLRKLLRKGS